MDTPNDWRDAPDWILLGLSWLVVAALVVYAIIGAVLVVRWLLRR